MIDRAFGTSMTGTSTHDARARGNDLDLVVDQVGRDVVAEASGALSLDGLIYQMTGLAGNGMRPSGCLYFVIGGDDILVDLYEIPGVQLPVLGTGTQLAVPDECSGDKFGFTNCNGSAVLYVPRGYAGDVVIGSRSVWRDTTLAALGLARAANRATMGVNFVTIDVGADPVPSAGRWSWGAASRIARRF